MTLTSILSTATNVEPFAWLLILIAMYLSEKRKGVSHLQHSNLKNVRNDEFLPEYRALGIFATSRLLSSLAYPILIERLMPLGISMYTARIVNTSLYWVLYLLSTICVFFIMAAIIKTSLFPLPGLSSAALIVFKWASFIVLIIALTAHLPVFGLHGAIQWLNEASISFSLCVCTFEIMLLVLLLKQLQRLGLWLRSRPIGFAFGITLLGCMDLVSALTLNLSTHIVVWVSLLNECVIFLTLAMWTFYIIVPEPKRNPPSLSPASKLMKWNEIALKLELGGRQAEHTPFISGVEATVDAILEKFKSRAS